MSPYRIAPTTPSEQRVASAWEERIIYGACIGFGVLRIVHAICFERAIGGLTTLAVLSGLWGARGLILLARRKP
jgi:hypothetical protein